MIERKLIGGSKHKRVPCIGCGDMIWIHWSVRKSIAICTRCDGLPGGINRQGGIRTDAGRGECDCSHEVQYQGSCGCD